MRLNGKTAVVTGGGSGFGAGICVDIMGDARRGCTMAAWGISGGSPAPRRGHASLVGEVLMRS